MISVITTLPKGIINLPSFSISMNDGSINYWMTTIIFGIKFRGTGQLGVVTGLKIPVT